MMAPARIQVAQVVTRFIAGAGGVALRGAMHLDPDRHQVTIVTGEGGPLTEAAEAAGMEVLLEPSLVAPIAPRRDLLATHRLTRLFRERRFDVVHTHSAKAGAIGRTAAYRVGTPVIVHTHHGFPFHDFMHPARRAGYLTIERRLARITDTVLAVGTGVATDAIRLGLARPAGIRTISPVVDGLSVPRSVETRAKARSALGLDPDVPVVGTVGRLDFQKAPEHLLDALGQMRRQDAVVVWIGSGPDQTSVARKAAEAGLAGRFILAGERLDVPHLLPAFDVFAMSSRYEGLPCAVVEAMRCGLPVVATAVNSVPDVVIPGETGLLVPAGRPALLAEAIDTLIAEPERAGRLAIRGRQLVGDRRFDAEALSAVLDEVYADGLARSGEE